ncbi:MAG: hypothetical protein PF542_03105 [Nanoarchaeota archaeon]|jgi:hypothetical protein|nr:hypothetical protein [Nanoarchaeota archaeon]
MNLEKLSKIQEDLINDCNGFPIKGCLSSCVKVFEELGFAPKAGYVISKGGIEPHNWNESEEGMIADVSLYQFEEHYGNEIDKIIFLPKDEAIHKYGYVESSENTKILQDFIWNKRYLPRFEVTFF